MATEPLHIPEENLLEVIDIIRCGMDAVSLHGVLSPTVFSDLSRWCNESEAYMLQRDGR